MTDSKQVSVRDEAWAKHAPEYMIEVVARITETRDDCREWMKRLLAREQLQAERDQVATDRQEAFAKAVLDMTALAGRLFGPESELTRLNSRLDELDAVRRRLDEHDSGFTRLESRVGFIEKQLKIA